MLFRSTFGTTVSGYTQINNSAITSYEDDNNQITIDGGSINGKAKAGNYESQIIYTEQGFGGSFQNTGTTDASTGILAATSAAVFTGVTTPNTHAGTMTTKESIVDTVFDSAGNETVAATTADGVETSILDNADKGTVISATRSGFAVASEGGTDNSFSYNTTTGTGTFTGIGSTLVTPLTTTVAGSVITSTNGTTSTTVDGSKITSAKSATDKTEIDGGKVTFTGTAGTSHLAGTTTTIDGGTITTDTLVTNKLVITGSGDADGSGTGSIVLADDGSILSNVKIGDDETTFETTATGTTTTVTDGE